MKKKKKFQQVNYKNIIYIFLRYIILLGLMFSLPIIYRILIPITVYLTSFLLSLIYNIRIMGSMIMVNSFISIEIISSCVAGSAYLLLLILNLTTPMKLNQRIKSIIFSLTLFFILNILRIFIFSILIVNNFKYFDLTHELSWLLISTLFVVGIWFLTAKLFKIKNIPIYSDIKYLLNLK
ncbi:MAG: pacearchaeosortase [Candidatus Pacearchaeota archaeon]